MPGIPEGILPAKAQSGVEPPSGIQGAGTQDQPYDQGNQPEQAAGPGIEPPSGQTGPGTADRPYDQGNQPENVPAEPTVSQAEPAQAQNPSSLQSQESRGRTDSKIDTSKLSARPRQHERSVSPGQLDDGTHVMTSGKKGESYTPGSNIGSKLKSKFHIGSH